MLSFIQPSSVACEKATTGDESTTCRRKQGERQKVTILKKRTIRDVLLSNVENHYNKSSIIIEGLLRGESERIEHLTAMFKEGFTRATKVIELKAK